MHTYVVGYELGDGHGAAPIEEHLGSYDEARRLLGTMWIIKTRRPLNQIKLDCRSRLEEGDRLLICKYQAGVDIAMWSGFDEADDRWLQAHL